MYQSQIEKIECVQVFRRIREQCTFMLSGTIYETKVDSVI